MNTTDSASARMEANIMKYFLNDPSMGTSKQAKQARKVDFLVGPDDDQEADEAVEIGKRYDTVSASVGKMSLFMSMYDVDPV
jgi:hypothetical protein